jgi:hypothetical protein
MDLVAFVVGKTELGADEPSSVRTASDEHVVGEAHRAALPLTNDPGAGCASIGVHIDAFVEGVGDASR